MYVYGPYMLVQAAVTVLTDLGYVIRITPTTMSMDKIEAPIYNIMEVIRMYRTLNDTRHEVNLEVVS